MLIILLLLLLFGRVFGTDVNLSPIHFNNFNNDVLKVAREIVNHQFNHVYNNGSSIDHFNLPFYGYDSKEAVTLVLKGNNDGGFYLYIIDIKDNGRSVVGGQQNVPYNDSNYRIPVENLRKKHIISGNSITAKKTIIKELALIVVESIRFSKVRRIVHSSIKSGSIELGNDIFKNYIRDWKKLSEKTYDEIIRKYNSSSQNNAATCSNKHLEVTVPLISVLIEKKNSRPRKKRSLWSPLKSGSHGVSNKHHQQNKPQKTMPHYLRDRNRTTKPAVRSSTKATAKRTTTSKRSTTKRLTTTKRTTTRKMATTKRTTNRQTTTRSKTTKSTKMSRTTRQTTIKTTRKSSEKSTKKRRVTTVTKRPTTMKMSSTRSRKTKNQTRNGTMKLRSTKVIKSSTKPIKTTRLKPNKSVTKIKTTTARIKNTTTVSTKTTSKAINLTATTTKKEPFFNSTTKSMNSTLIPKSTTLAKNLTTTKLFANSTTMVSTKVGNYSTTSVPSRNTTKPVDGNRMKEIEFFYKSFLKCFH